MDDESAVEVCDDPQTDPSSVHMTEHNYSKESSPSSEEAMDTADGSEGCPSLTALAENKDTFETLLLCLLQSFTQSQQKSCEAGQDETIPTSVAPDCSISSEALGTLSSEQIMLLVTSNSVNYEVIQQIIAQKPRPLANSALGRVRAAAAVAASKEPNIKPDTAAPPPLVDTAASIATRVSPDQLQVLQEHITELFRTQQITLPANISPEQQQQLIQSLLLQLLQEQQNKAIEEATSITSKPSPSPPPPTSPPTQPSAQQKGTTPPSGEHAGGSTLPLSASQPEAVAPPTSSKPPQASQPAGAQTEAVASPVATPTTSEGHPDLVCHEMVKPKKPLPPYDIFFNEVYSIVMAANSTMGFTEASRIISTMWNALGPEVKQRYNDQHDTMQREYDEAMKQYVASQAEQAASLIRSVKASHPLPPPPKRSAQPASLARDKAGSRREESDAAHSEINIKVLRNTANAKPVQKSQPKDASMCVANGCYTTAVLSEERGPQYCSNECAVKHARQIFTKWISQRKASKT